MLSITTDYLNSVGNPEPYLKKISEAGFSYIHWCHEWNTDFVYSESEINKITTLLEKYNLKVLDIHASAGKKNNWVSNNEFLRIAGIELVKNRIYMANKLSCDVIILHLNNSSKNESEKILYRNILHKSLNDLKSYAKKYNVRIALENCEIEDLKEIEKLFSIYDSNFLGLCYDSGHGNLGGGLKMLEKLKDRLISIHLNDNDGENDQHRLPFIGTINWNELIKVLGRSSYKKCISLEVHMENPKFKNETSFLSAAYSAGVKISKLLNHC